MKDIIQVMPAVALRGMTILPDMIVHFDVSRSKSKKAVERAMTKNQKLFVVTQRDPDIENPEKEELFTAGCIVTIKQMTKLQHGLIRVLVEAVERAELIDFLDNADFLEAEVTTANNENDLDGLPEECIEAMLRGLLDTFHQYVKAHGKLNKDVARQLAEMDDLERLMNLIPVHAMLKWQKMQTILDVPKLTEKYEQVLLVLNNEMEILQIKRDLEEKVKAKVDKNQKEYILREELKTIREELGEDNIQSELDGFLEETRKLKAPKEVKEKLEKEIGRLKLIGMNSSESGVIRGYVETLLEMPWSKMQKETSDIKLAQKILDEDHYGLEQVKERVLEFLAVRTLNKHGQSPILCLVGPPGTGKTSIAKSIAKALNKKYVRICLGGVQDEAEIRGHRRTYVGAMPGRIATGMKQAGVKNPLMLLDEIDKVSSNYRGDTSAALLEVLDSEQNNKFRDHYIELPMDLSEVLFIATANDAHNIPRPLYDRMEIIEVTSYTENEKFHIAKEHLLPKQLEKNGLKPEQMKISDKGLQALIRSYTREAGVRSLERRLGELCRKAARQILENDKKIVRITDTNLEKFLGKPVYSFNLANEQDEIGIVRGLAWTSVGGDTLQIEVNVMPGKGEVALTGQLGDVMKESARAGLTYIRSIVSQYGVEKEYFEKHDFHIHIPEGAVPKDGPSAGITMATAMLSAIIEKPVKATVAMTGEITLRGRVLPIGGLKEKILAAKNAGIKTVLVPKKNEKDIEEISAEIKRGIEIVFVEHMEQVIAQALVQ
ncbi:MAG: endopeptidase La [Lachnospiraceae bacterium]|nr:endopeptidase La [Lachnospiraceae bacterium]